MFGWLGFGNLGGGGKGHRQGPPGPGPRSDWREQRRNDPEWQKRREERKQDREQRKAAWKQEREAWKQERQSWKQERDQWRQQWQQMRQQPSASPAPAPTVVPASVAAVAPVVAAAPATPAPAPQITPAATKPTQADFDKAKTEWLRSIQMLNRARSGVGFSTKAEMDRGIANAQAEHERARGVYQKMQRETGFSGYRRFAGYRRPGNLAGIFSGWDRSM